MHRAGLAIGLAAILTACSGPVATRDVAGIYTGTLGDGEAYRLEMGEDALYRFCRAGNAQCSPHEDRGRYHVVRLGAKSLIEFSLLCITFENECMNYEADVRRSAGGAVEITFVDHGGASRVFRKSSAG